MTLHRVLTGDNLHALPRWEFANQTAMDAVSGVIEGDVGKMAWKKDDDTFFVLTNHSPITWAEFSGGRVKSTLLPDMTGATGYVSQIDIGSATEKFKSLYVQDAYIDASSLYVNDKKVIEDDSGTITVKTDPNEDLKLLTTGTGDTLVITDNEFNINAKGGVETTVPNDSATKHINFSNASAGGNVTFYATGTNAQVQFNATEEIDLTAPEIDLNGDVDISGTLTLGGGGLAPSDVGLGNVPNVDCTDASNISSGTLPSSVLPPVALVQVFTAANEAAMLALTTEEGDVVVRTDESKSYMHNGGSAGTMADFTEMQSPSDIVTSVNGQTGTVVVSKSDVGLGNVPNTDFTAAIGSNTTHRQVTTGNPHSVTKADVGLGSVPNTDFTTSVASNTSHRQATTGNPHSVSKSDVGLGNVQNVDTTDADNINDSSSTNKFTTAAEISKLSGIEAGAEANPTASETKAAYESNSDTNAFTDADHTKLDGIESGAETNNISDVNATDLTDGGDSTLHYHAADRNRSNHTGNQTASTISDFDTEVSNNVSVASNTSHRSNSSNPHSVTKSQVGLGNVPNVNCTNASNISTGTLPSSVLPPIALTSVQTAANQSAMLGLTTEEGDVVVRTDESKSYVHNGGSAGTMADFTELQAPTGTVLSVNGDTGTVVLNQDDIGNGSTYVRTENNFTDTLLSKLNSVETGADVNDSATEILVKLRTVDGPSCGLDVQYLQSAIPATTAIANSIAKRDASGDLYANKVYNAVYNDLADFIKLADDDIQYGKCYRWTNKGSSICNEPCQKGVLGIASDTFGFALGKEEGKLPLAVAGLALAYVVGECEIGDPLTNDAEGNLVKMNTVEKQHYPERILATYMGEEEAEFYGTENEVEVDGRHWVKIK